MKQSQNNQKQKNQGQAKGQSKPQAAKKPDKTQPIKNQPPKESYGKFSFWFPIAYAVINVIIIALAAFWASQGLTSIDGTIHATVATIASALVIMSPSALILTMYISMRHSKKYVASGNFYRLAPFRISFFVVVCEVLYFIITSLKFAQ